MLIAGIPPAEFQAGQNGNPSKAKKKELQQIKYVAANRPTQYYGKNYKNHFGKTPARRYRIAQAIPGFINKTSSQKIHGISPEFYR